MDSRIAAPIDAEIPPPPSRRGLATRAFELIGVVAFIIMFGSTLLGVIARYFEFGGVEWSFEVAGIAFIWITFIGLINAEIRGDNVAFEALKQSAPPRLKAVFDGVAVLALLGMGITFLISGIAVWRHSWMVPTSVLRLPTGVIIATVIILGAAATILALCRAWRRFGIARHREEKSA